MPSVNALSTPASSLTQLSRALKTPRPAALSSEEDGS